MMIIGTLKERIEAHIPNKQRIKIIDNHLEWLISEVLNEGDDVVWLAEKTGDYISHFRHKREYRLGVSVYNLLLNKILSSWRLKDYKCVEGLGMGEGFNEY